jgi:hypothetical protein
MRGNGEKVCAVLPVDAARVNEAKIRLIDQCGCLQRVSGALAAHALAGQPAQLLVNERHELFERRLIAAPPLEEKLCDVSCHERAGGPSGFDKNYAY